MTEDNLILSQNGFIVDDRVHVNMHELSYVDNTFDVTGIKQFPAPPPSNLEYYVPPSGMYISLFKIYTGLQLAY